MTDTEQEQEAIVEEADKQEEQPTAEVEQEERDLEQELEEARAQAAEYLDGWQRTQAEFSNYRKRREAEWQQRTQMSNAALIAKILPLLDDLERAMQTMPEALRDFTWVDGLVLIVRKLEVVLESEGVKQIETAGQMFDPVYHEAITYEQAEGYEEGQIIGEVQRGYMLGERVIRPALVRVAQAPPQPVEEEKEKAETEEDQS